MLLGFCGCCSGCWQLPAQQAAACAPWRLKGARQPEPQSTARQTYSTKWRATQTAGNRFSGKHQGTWDVRQCGSWMASAQLLSHNISTPAAEMVDCVNKSYAVCFHGRVLYAGLNARIGDLGIYRHCLLLVLSTEVGCTGPLMEEAAAVAASPCMCPCGELLASV